MTVPPKRAPEPFAARSRSRRTRPYQFVTHLVLVASSIALPATWSSGSWALSSPDPAPPGWLANYHVASQCPSAASFVAMVAERLSTPLERAPERTTIAIEIATSASAPNSFVGRIQVQEGAAEASARAVAGNACAEVAEALSLIAAISLEPGSRADPAADRPSLPLPALDETHSVELREQRSISSRFGVFASVLTNGAAAPGLGFGAGLELAFEPARNGFWSPLVQLGAYVLERNTVNITGDARAHFNLVAAHGLACPVRIPSGGVWSLRPCLDFDLGQLTGSGSGRGVIDGRSRSGLWASAGTGVQLALDVWGPIRLGFFAAAVVPFARHEFFFGPDTLAFRVPALSARGAAWAGVMF